MALTGDHDGVNDGGALSGVGMSDKQEVLFAQSRGADGVFLKVVVDFGNTVLEVGHQLRPLPERIGACLAQGGLRQCPTNFSSRYRELCATEMF